MKTKPNTATGATPPKAIQPLAKKSKIQAYSKNTFKSNWSNTKTVYTRPR